LSSRISSPNAATTFFHPPLPFFNASWQFKSQ
jgi:hypothetical protein